MEGIVTPMDPDTDQHEPSHSVTPPQALPEDTVPDDPAPPEDAAEEAADPPIEIQPHRVVEAILIAADTPVTAAKIAAILGIGTARDAKKHIETLNRQYEELGLSFRIEHIAGGYQVLTLSAYDTWLTKLLKVRQETKMSPAAMETLSIVAYKQPCTRADIEAIRGVAAGDMLNRLREMNLVKIVGRAEDLGRPMLYGTTKRFLETFGLPSLEDLPQVEAFKRAAPATTESEQAPAMEETAETDTSNDDDATPSDERPSLHVVNEDDDADPPADST